MEIDLSGLRDIHLPIEPPWWPLATGWWLVLAGFCLFLFVCALCYLYWYTRPRQYALRELKSVFAHETDPVIMARKTSILLKRIALLLYPRTKIATLSDESWIDFLIKKTGKCFSEEQLNFLAMATYMPENSQTKIIPTVLCASAQKAIIKLFERKKNGRKGK